MRETHRHTPQESGSTEGNFFPLLCKCKSEWEREMKRKINRWKTVLEYFLALYLLLSYEQHPQFMPCFSLNDFWNHRYLKKFMFFPLTMLGVFKCTDLLTCSTLNV